MDTFRVAVLMGGTSSERDVSLRSGANVIAALRAAGHAVQPLDFTGDLAPVLALTGQVDVVFLALHGPGGEDGRMQGVLDLLGLPYTGSGVLASAMAMHKGVARAMCANHAIPIPAGIWADAGESNDAVTARVLAEMGVPCVVKPAQEGSTIGISIVRDVATLADAITLARRYDAELVVEQFVAGVEISVPVIGSAPPRALPAVEVVPANGTYDYEMKYTPGATAEYCPARISAAATARAAEIALRAHEALHCRNLSRTDMIVCGDDVVVLETNTLPGMTDTSLLPLAAKTVGLSFPELVTLLVADAIAEFHQ
jgi:D-alanine-D-alanine ligase